MKNSVPILLAAVTGLQLAACGAGGVAGALDKLNAPPRPMASETADAPPLNADRSRRLFLIIVQGLKEDGKSRAAIAYLRQYAKLYPNDPKAQLLLADCLVDTQQEAEAAQIYGALGGGAEAGPSEAGLGRVAASRAEWDRAAGYFQRAAARDAANASYLNDLGYAQMMTAHYGAALASLSQANELAPEQPMIRSNLILALHLAGRDAEARRLISRIGSPEERARSGNLLSLDAAKLHVMPAPQTVASAETASGAGPAP